MKRIEKRNQYSMTTWSFWNEYKASKESTSLLLKMFNIDAVCEPNLGEGNSKSQIITDFVLNR